ncbi:MAG: hypothetical protein MJ229_06120 [bacterium]|nr:hypothetical protein [bacterium]
MKKILITLLLFFTMPCFANAETTSTQAQIQPQQIDFNICNKVFKIDTQKLFYLTLASVNANRFKIEEIKSQNGYILFSVAQKQYLASVVKIDAKNSMLKITPCNNVYYFPAGIVQNMFKYIELNVSTPIQRITIL